MILDNDKRIDEKIKGAMQPENAEKILIVDDEKDIRKLVGIYLKRQGYQILEAENGKQAIDLVRENSDIDLIIMDIICLKCQELRVALPFENFHLFLCCF